jgi:hypothetical protein
VSPDIPPAAGLGGTGWGEVDLFSLGVGIGVLVLFLTVRKRHRNVQAAIVLLRSGISLGPPLLILSNPFAQRLAFGSLLPGVPVR